MCFTGLGSGQSVDDQWRTADYFFMLELEVYKVDCKTWKNYDILSEPTSTAVLAFKIQCKAHEKNIRFISSSGVGNSTAHEQSVICRHTGRGCYRRSSSILPAPLSFLTNSRSVMLNSTSPLSSTCTSNPAIPGTILKCEMISLFLLWNALV